MDCDTNGIACAIDQLSARMNEPSAIEWLALVVSACAAIGTLWIAWLNLRLLRRQNDFEAEIIEEKYRALRRRYASILRVHVANVLYDSNALRSFDSEEESVVFEQLEELRDELGPRGLPLPRAWAVLEASTVDATEYADVEKTIERVREILNRWVNDPKSVAAEITVPPDSGVEPRD
ncbi:hypothetical protein [Leucobacter massiliensis]|uniref:hypothetical protein n=1 Tax=Leucobacter massiliensis TaxID=1686285 RepID=UPI0011B281BC|nr:hypothetical protein [Leucobacter massiliensis]